MDPPRADDPICLDAFARVSRTCEMNQVAAQQNQDDAVCATATELDRLTKKVVTLFIFSIFFSKFIRRESKIKNPPNCAN